MLSEMSQPQRTGTVGFYLHEESNAVQFIQSALVSAQGWRERMMLMFKEYGVSVLHFRSLELQCWRDQLQNNVIFLTILNCTLKNSRDGKIYLM